MCCDTQLSKCRQLKRTPQNQMSNEFGVNAFEWFLFWNFYENIWFVSFLRFKINLFSNLISILFCHKSKYQY